MEPGRERAAPVKQKWSQGGSPEPGRNVVSLWALPSGSPSHLVAEATGRLTTPTRPRGRPPVGIVHQAPLHTFRNPKGFPSETHARRPAGEGGARFFEGR